MKKALKIFLNIFTGLGLGFMASVFASFGVSIVSHKNTFTNSTTKQVKKDGEVKYVKDDGSYSPYLCKVDENGQLLDDFKIMCCTDTHLSPSDDNELTLTVLSRMIDIVKPDLIVFDGDNIVNTTGTQPQKELNKLLEEKGIYWTFVLGNHDHQPWEEQGIEHNQAKKIAFDTECGKELDGSGSQSPHCIAATKGNGDDIGYGTNYINIRGSNKNIIQTLFFFDCDKIRETNNDVINWYKQSIDEIKAENNNVTPKSVAFNHIPFVEMKYAADHKNNTDVKYYYGTNDEPMCLNNDTNGLIEVFNELGSTNNIIFGHDHENNMSISYKNVRMTYSSGLQYNSYCRRKGWKSYPNAITHAFTSKYDNYIDGVTNLYVNSDQTVTFGCNYAQFENNIFKGLEHKLYKRTFGYITTNSVALNAITITSFTLLCLGVSSWYGYLIYDKIKRK